MTSRRDFLFSPLRSLGRSHTETNSDTKPDQSKRTNNCKTEISDNTYELSALYADFTTEALQFEVMKMGIDPSGMEKSELLQLVYKRMMKISHQGKTTDQNE